MDEQTRHEREPVSLLRIWPDATERAGLGRTSLYAEIAAGRLRVVRIGRAVRVRSDDLAAWIEDRTADSASVA